MGVRAWQWAVMVVAVGVAVGGPWGVEGLKCYRCHNCIKYEKSQSQACGADDTRCMKMHMQTGQVQRRCGTEDMCLNSEKELKTKYTEVHCCTDNNCNLASSLSPAPLLLLLLLLLPSAAVGPRLLLHC